MDQPELTLISIAILLTFLLMLVCVILNTFKLISSVRLQNLAAAGEPKAQIILNLLGNQTRLFLTFNLLKGLLIGGLVIKFSHFEIWLTFVLTLIVLLFSETIALAISKVNPDKTIIRLSKVIQFIINLFIVLYWLANALLKLFSLLLKPQVENIMTEQELLNIIDEAQSEGGLQEFEGDLIRRSIEFNDLLVEEILTPRVDLVALDIKWNKDKILRVLEENEYSRYPVYKDSIDTIIGVVHTKDFKQLNDDFSNLEDIINPVIFVPESYKISELLKLIQKNKSHLAVIIDEYGGTAGIVTLEDIVEELVGEIWDEHDEEELEITQVNPYQTIVLASVELYKLEEAIDYDLDSQESDASTVGGWIIELTGKIPKVSQEVFYKDLKITILEADEKKIIKVLVETKDREMNTDEETN